MDSRLQPVAQIFTLSEGLYRKSLNGLTRDELLRSPGESSNSMLWIAGHLAHTRYLLLNLLGANKKKPWDDIFARGAEKDNEPGKYPGIEEIMSVWDEATRELYERFEKLTAAELEGASPRELPSVEKTFLGALSFFAFHETYHVGQLAYILKWLGKGQLVG
ncbi:MAG: DinB family protein [Candidatus Eremiobacteraeota bacterium]|nr:DinB family protein [Candidatus Eremiobacteraeota bacterium]